jgi:CCR4-NOT transcription complex subunit 9
MSYSQFGMQGYPAVQGYGVGVQGYAAYPAGHPHAAAHHYVAAAPYPPAAGGYHPGVAAQPMPHAAAPVPKTDENTQKMNQLVGGLLSPESRELALHELSKNRENFPDLAPVLWYSCGVVAVLLQEIISVYPMLSPPTLQVAASNRICNALSLLQCVAAHNATRTAFLSAHIPMFLYPFLNIQSTERPFEYLRLTSLGVIGALVKSDDPEVINFLLGTEMVPLCLKIMENGSELSKTVATFVVQKILLFDSGLSYICATPERFLAVAQVLRAMVTAEDCSARLLRHIVRCYLRLTDHNRARDALKQTLPDQLRDNTFATIIAEDPNIKKWLFQLLVNIGDPGALSLESRGQAPQ